MLSKHLKPDPGTEHNLDQGVCLFRLGATRVGLIRLYQCPQAASANIWAKLCYLALSRSRCIVFRKANSLLTRLEYQSTIIEIITSIESICSIFNKNAASKACTVTFFLDET